MTNRMLPLVLMLLLVPVALFPPGIAGQERERGTVTGTVLGGAERRPVAGALVLLDSGDREITDDEGKFVFHTLTPGRYRIAAITPGCGSAEGVLDLPDLERATVELLVGDIGAGGRGSSPGADAPASVLGDPTRVISSTALRSMEHRSLLEALQASVPHLVGMVSPYPGASAYLTGRGTNSVSLPASPIVVIDGVRIQGRPELALDAIDPADVARVEIFRGASGAWAYAGGAADGLIHVRTRGAGGGSEVLAPPETCLFSFSPP